LFSLFKKDAILQNHSKQKNITCGKKLNGFFVANQQKQSSADGAVAAETGYQTKHSHSLTTTQYIN
jgi:hypothetical protein